MPGTDKICKGNYGSRSEASRLLLLTSLSAITSLQAASSGHLCWGLSENSHNIGEDTLVRAMQDGWW